MKARAGAAIALALAAFACDPSVPAAPPAAPGAPPARIVSLAPSITETLFLVGAGAQVAGVTSHCDFPPDVAAKAKIGGYNTPNLELVIAARPDLVIVPREGAILGAVEKLRDLGLRVEAISVTRLADVPASIERIGALAGREAEGRAEAARIGAALSAIEERVIGRPRVRALFVVDREPVIAAGSGTFADDLLRAAGGENAAGRTLSSYPQLGAEAILAAAPAVVIDAWMAPTGPAEAERRAREYWASFPDLPAVRGGRVHAIDPDLLVRPGPRLAMGLVRAARALHPDAFPR